MKTKIFLVTDDNIIKDLKLKGINNFAYPLTFFCVGIPHTFTIEEIKENNSYIYINKNLSVLDTFKLKNILDNLNSNIKGIIFEDLSLINLTKNLNIEKILYMPHGILNYKSINYFLEYVDTIILSNDLNMNEIDEIISKANKKLSIMAFGLIPSLYTERKLLTNYSTHFNTEYHDKLDLETDNKKFISIENDNGTVLYHYPYFYSNELLEKDFKYLFYYPLFLSNDEVLNIANNNYDNISYDDGFLNKKTYFKIVRGDNK